MKLKHLSMMLAGSLAASMASAAVQTAVPATIAAAVADASRPATDTQRDVNRKPAEVLTFAGVKPGDNVGELLPGRGYFTRLFCKAVGDKGHVYTVSITPTQMRGPPPPDMPQGPNPGGAPRAGGPGPGPAAAEAPPPAGTPCSNVTASSLKGSEFKLPGSLDLVWTSENYHDLHNEMFGVGDLKTFNKVVFDALKPGGLYLIEDHAAAAGSGVKDSNTLHRIDPATVIAEVTAAGFVLDARSQVLANPGDPHTENVFKLSGKSDKFLLKFRKPSR